MTPEDEVRRLRERVAELEEHLRAMVDLADYHVHEIEGIARESRDPADIRRAKRCRALFNAADHAAGVAPHPALPPSEKERG